MFHALVAIKQVPDTTNIRIDPETGNLVREGVPAIMNPYDAHALAAAVEWKQKLDGKVTVISMGPSSVFKSLREAVELGADRGILLSSRKFAGADTLATSYVLAQTIKAIHEVDPIHLLFFGKQAIDGDTAQVGPGVAGRLDLPILTYVTKIHEVDLDNGTVSAERKTEQWSEIVKTPLPTALTCNKAIAEIPYAPLPDLVRSLNYEPEVWSMKEGPVEFEKQYIGIKGSPTIVFGMGSPEPPEAGEKFNARDLGVNTVAKNALDAASAAGILEEILGGEK